MHQETQHCVGYQKDRESDGGCRQFFLSPCGGAAALGRISGRTSVLHCHLEAFCWPAGYQSYASCFVALSIFHSACTATRPAPPGSPTARLNTCLLAPSATWLLVWISPSHVLLLAAHAFYGPLAGRVHLACFRAIPSVTIQGFLLPWAMTHRRATPTSRRTQVSK